MSGIQEGASCIRRLFHAVSHVSMRRTGDTRRVCASVLGVRKNFFIVHFYLAFLFQYVYNDNTLVARMRARSSTRRTRHYSFEKEI